MNDVILIPIYLFLYVKPMVIRNIGNEIARKLLSRYVTASYHETAY